MDTNVLIDYWVGDRNLLRLVSLHVAPIHIPSSVFREINQLTRRTSVSLKIQIDDTPHKQLVGIAGELGPLSLQDRDCLILAKKIGASCVSNDKALRRECQTQGIAVIWGLEPIILLVELGAISNKTAVNAVVKMQEENPFITPNIVSDFHAKIRWKV